MSFSQSQQTEQSSETTTQTEAGARLINRRDAIKLLAVSVGALALVGMTLPENAPLPAKWLAPTVATATPTAHAIASWVDGDENGGNDDTDPTDIARDSTEQAQTESAYTSTPTGPATQTPTPTETATSTSTPSPTPTKTRRPYVPPTNTPQPPAQPPQPQPCDPAVDPNCAPPPQPTVCDPATGACN